MDMQETAQLFYNLGLHFMGLNHLETTLICFRNALMLGFQPAARAYNKMGSICFRAKGYEEALQMFSSAISEDNSYSIAYYNRCNTYSRMSEYKKAVKDCSKAIELDSSDADYYKQRAFLYEKLGKTKLSLADKAAVEKLPESSRITGADLSERQKAEQAVHGINPDAVMTANARIVAQAGFSEDEIHEQTMEIMRSFSMPVMRRFE